jgi:sulfate transport system ATP-binding protein
VVEHPASAFVMTFVGNVNIFHGRVQSGKAVLGPLAVDYPGHSSPEALSAAGYARPHELEISRTDSGDGLWATVRDVRISGALVKIELSDASGTLIQVELGRDLYDRLAVVRDELAYVKPKRVRVFTSE